MSFSPCPKPSKKHKAVKAAKRRMTEKHERQQKALVRARDLGCRWPHCPCHRQSIRLEAAHVKAKGMGGDHGERSGASNMILLCYLAHQGPHSLHSGDRRVVPVDERRGTNGPCRFETKIDNAWVVVETESHIGIYRSDVCR